MHALISRADDPTPRLEEVTPTALGPDDVRVAVAAAGFTLFDAFVAADHSAIGLPDLIGLGFDFSGTVIATGSSVTTLSIDDRVAGLHGDAAAPARAHASEVVVPAADVAPLPDGLELERAAAIPLNALTARQALDLLGETRGRLLVTGGAGGVGGWAVALARRDGWDVDALVRPGSESIAKAAGAGRVVTEVPTAAYDAVLDAAALQEAALGAVHDGGRFVGVKPGRSPEGERDVQVQVVLNHPDGAALAPLLRLAGEGAAPIRIAAKRPLAQAADLYAEAQAAPGVAGRWLLTPEQP